MTKIRDDCSFYFELIKKHSKYLQFFRFSSWGAEEGFDQEIQRYFGDNRDTFRHKLSYNIDHLQRKVEKEYLHEGESKKCFTMLKTQFETFITLKQKEKSLDYNNSFLGEYECSSLALDREEKRDEKKRLDHLKQDQTMQENPTVTAGGPRYIWGYLRAAWPIRGLSSKRGDHERWLRVDVVVKVVKEYQECDQERLVLAIEEGVKIEVLTQNEDEVVPKVDDVSLVDGVFDGAFLLRMRCPRISCYGRSQCGSGCEGLEGASMIFQEKDWMVEERGFDGAFGGDGEEDVVM
ncbi:hypothetical protein Tco_1054316 [Tanacetum coccineum]|uniref:Uncharacterized protein n=1 Tax=Tanacetum coccineum TaxID=301880 RepID=A0ABQ5GWU4_9ASTR